MTDEELVRTFEACTLPPAEFNHAAHVRAARWYLMRYDFDEAFERFSTALKRFATAAGKPEKYDADITLTYMRQIACVVRRPGAPRLTIGLLHTRICRPARTGSTFAGRCRACWCFSSQDGDCFFKKRECGVRMEEIRD